MLQELLGSMFEKYVSLLREKDIKVTTQRLEILQYLDTHRTHPTVDKIYTALKKNNPALSKTTVYNAVDVLKKHGLIISITLSGHEQRYDFRHDMHHHFLCRKCGKIIDIDIECPNIGKVLQSGHKVEEVQGYFKGICMDCIKKEHT